MDVVLGVSMGSAAIQMVVIEGENADGATLDEDDFRVGAGDVSAAPGQTLAAILGTRQGAAQAGHQLTSTGVAWTHPGEAAVLHDTLAAHNINDVMLVSSLLAAAALTHTVGHAIGDRHTALLLIEPDSATVAMVDSADGSVTAVRKEPLLIPQHGGDTDTEIVGQLAAMVMGTATNGASLPDGVFAMCHGVDVVGLKPALEAALPLRVNAAEEPHLALARGAALASANAPLFVSSTAALAYAQDPGTGEVDGYTLTARRNAAGIAHRGGQAPVAYSDIADDDSDADTIHVDTDPAERDTQQRRKSLLLASGALGMICITAAVALELAVALKARPTVALLPNPVENPSVPTEQATIPTPPAPTSPAPPPTRQTEPAPQPAEDVLSVPSPEAPEPASPIPAIVPVPAPAASVPGPNIQLPDNGPHTAPRMDLPAPPIQRPRPPIQLPRLPIALPALPIGPPKPPVRVQRPAPKVERPKRKAPALRRPAPVRPRVPILAPALPRIPSILPNRGR
ncbi:DUF7159 family protein [Mycobacterium spongiae]|uniref:DUF7159 domain-containing protein n=1 Tax=Mycobacterium spongiae TaxID=886343 RepID=A0A975PWU5_9MYCO|nr:hypothetical protein [Mycobacterium spongiae]QUR67124.1 hypothetical protein F6B93_08460 [Mycobacterium spongiae]